MSRILKLDVKEDLKYLRERYRHEKNPQIRERLHMLYLYKSGIAVTRAELSVSLGICERSLTVLFNKYRNGGLSELLELKYHGGKKRSIPDNVLDKLKEKLSNQEGFGSYHEIKDWIKNEYGLDIPYKTVYGTVRYYLKGKLKTVRPKSALQNEEDKLNFKKSCRIVSAR